MSLVWQSPASAKPTEAIFDIIFYCIENLYRGLRPDRGLPRQCAHWLTMTGHRQGVEGAAPYDITGTKKGNGVSRSL